MYNRLTNFLGKTFEDRFKRYLIISLVILGIVLIFTGQEATKPTADEGFGVHFSISLAVHTVMHKSRSMKS